MSPPVLCSACMQREATKLCDLVLGWPAVVDDSGDTPRLVRSMTEPPYTCSAPLCDGCAKFERNTFYCGGKAAGMETTDLCPHHGDIPDSRDLLTPAGAERARARVQIRPLVMP